MRNGKKIVALLGLLAAAAAGPAAAQDKGLYVGAQAGIGQWQESCENRAGVCDDKDGAFRGFLGYQVNRWFAVEGGYADFGSIKITDAPLGTLDLEGRGYAFDLLAVFTIPLADRLSLLGKAGAYRARVSADERVSGASSGQTSAGFAYGFGLGYDIGKLGLRAEFLRYDNIGGDRTGTDNILVYTLGLLFRFY